MNIRPIKASVSLPPSIHSRAKAAAKDHGVSLSTFVAEVVAEKVGMGKQYADAKPLWLRRKEQ